MTTNPNLPALNEKIAAIDAEIARLEAARRELVATAIDLLPVQRGHRCTDVDGNEMHVYQIGRAEHAKGAAWALRGRRITKKGDIGPYHATAYLDGAGNPVNPYAA